MSRPSFSRTLTRMGHDIKRIADDEWESSNPIDFRGTQTKNNYAQRAYADFNDEDYLSLGVDKMKETGDKSGQYALYNAKTDGRKALDIAHLNLDDYYGSHITGSGLPNSGSAYSYDASALKVLPKDIGKLSTNEQMDTPGQKASNLKVHRRSMGLPDVIPTVTQPTIEPHEVEQEEEAPPEGGVGKPDAPPPKSEADIQAERMAEASKKATDAGEASVGGASSVAGGDVGGTTQFAREELDTMRTMGGRTVTSKARSVKGTPASDKARGEELVTATKEEVEGEEDEGEEAGTEATSRAGGGGAGGFKAGHKFETRKAELEKAFPGIANGRKNAKEASYGTLSTGQQKFMVAIAQGKPGKPSEDLMENYMIDQGTATERQHDYMMKMIDAHDKAQGKKGLTGWATNLSEVGREIPSLSLGKLFSLSPEGRNIVYQSTKSMGFGWLNPSLKTLPDHDLDVLLSLYRRVSIAPESTTRGEKSVASMVRKNATEETSVSFGERMKRLKAKGYEK